MLDVQLRIEDVADGWDAMNGLFKAQRLVFGTFPRWYRHIHDKHINRNPERNEVDGVYFGDVVLCWDKQDPALEG